MKRDVRPALVALLYAVFGALWILLSDSIANRFISEGASLPLVQTFKGLFYVGITSGLVYGLVRYSTRRIREERSRYREMAENIEDLFYNYDPIHDRLLYAGPAFVRIWGLTIAQAHAEPMSYLERIHPEDRPAAWDADRRQRLGEPTETEYRVVRDDGHVTWVLDRSVSVLGADGRVERIVGTMRDITAIKQAQGALAESQRQLSTLLDNLPGAAYRCRLDKDWTTLFMSEGITALTGYQPSEFFGNVRLYAECIHPDDAEFIFDRIEKAARRGQSYEVEYRIFTRDGVEKSVWERGRFFPDAQGGDGFLEGFILDITDRKRAETERQRLEERVNQNQKLEAIGQLAGGVAHDFNNLLTVILVRAEMALRKVKPGDTLYTGLREIHDAAARSTGLARQLLTYAQRQPVRTEVRVITPLVEAALPMLRRLVGGDIRLAWALYPDLWPTAITPTHLDQILVNLCINARDAIPHEGKIRIETHNIVLDAEDCKTRPELKPGDHVVLSVADTGVGMNRATINRLFEPFFTTKEVGKGTGLGLPTVHGIVRQINGAIEVDSEPGKGSVFRIFLPRVHNISLPDAPTSPRARNVLKSETMNALPTGSGETVLVVDEDPGMRRLAADILSNLGYSVLEAYSAEAAESIARDHVGVIHLILSHDESEGGPKGLITRLETLRPDAAHITMSGAPAVASADSNSGISASPIKMSGGRKTVVRKPFATAELAIKAYEAIGAHRARIQSDPTDITGVPA